MEMNTTESFLDGRRLWGRFFRIRTIKNRLLVAFVLLVVLPIFIITTRTILTGWRNGQTQTIRQLEAIVTLKEAEINRWLDSLELNLKAILTNPESVDLVPILNGEDVNVDAVESSWTKLIEYTDLFEELFLINQQGRVVLTNGSTAVGTIHSNQTYFQEGLQGAFIHPPFYSPTLSSMSIVIAHPVMDTQGQVRGVLVGRASISTLNEIMEEQMGMGETGETYLVGMNHALLTNVLSVESDVQDADLVIFVRSEGANNALDSRLNGSGLYENYDQEPIIGVYHWLPRLQVALLAEQAQTEVFAPLVNSLLQELGLGILALISALIVAYYINRSLTRPLYNLTETAQQIVGGDYRLMAEVEREDEIGALALAFNQMTTHLNQLITDLEDNINELEMAQLSLQESEDRYRTLYYNAPIMMHSIDEKGVLVSVNKHWLTTLEYTYEEVVGLPVVTFLTEASRRYARDEVIPKFVETGYAENVSYQFVTKSGRILDVLLTATAHIGSQAQYQYSLAVIQDVTERKQVERALRENMARYQALFEYAHDAIWVYSLDDEKVVTANSQASKLSGYTLDEMIGKRAEFFILPEEVPDADDRLQQVIETGRTPVYERILVCKNGERKVFELKATLIKDGDGKPILFQGAGRDITERKRAEEELRLSEERHRALLEAMPDMMFRLNTAGIILDFKAENEDQLALPASEIIGTELSATPIPSDIVKEMMRLVRQTAETAQMSTYEYSLEVPLGLQTFETRMIKSGKDEVITFVRNVTERRKIMEALRSSERHLNTIISNAPISMTVTNLEGKYQQVNEAMCKMIGYSESELLQLTFDDITLEADLSIGQEAVAQALAGEAGRFQYEKRYIHKDGHLIWAITSIQLVRDEEGRPSYFIGQIQNITDRKQTELRLSTLLQEKEVLLKEIHHRVKNNLQIITSLLDLQSDYLESDSVKVMFQESRSRVRSMALVHEHLYQSADLSRINFGDYINGLAGYLMRVYGHLEQDVRLDVDVDSALMSVEMAVPLGLIINELVSNALKHAFPMEQPGLIIVQLKKVSSTEFRLIIQDNGVGLPTNMDIRQSPSLGLTIVMTLINQLQATLNQFSQKQGTCFEIAFSVEDKEV